METFTLTLSDGTVIENLRKNGDNFISDTELTEDMFEGNLSTITISDGERETVLEHMDLVQIIKMGEEYWFVIRQFSEYEIQMRTMVSNIDFLAMLQDVEL